MKFRYLTLALVLAGTLTACDKPADKDDNKAASTPALSTDDSKVLATVNGTPITENIVILYEQQRQGHAPGNQGQNRKAILEEIISLELVRQDGEAQGVDKSPEVQSQIAQQRRAVIASAAFQKKLKSNPITDEELKALYDEKTQGGNEYKARHILVKDEKTAKDLIAQLDKGADFAELAKEHSTGPSGKSGGDLGWFAPKSMVKPFSDAVIDMEKGAYTKEPVKTQFGWHIILLEDTRKTTPPPFEQVKSQLQMMVRNQRIQDYIQSLREKAEVEIVEVAVVPPASAPADEHEHAEHDHDDQHAPAAETEDTETKDDDNTSSR